jgi:hypothetical protein
VLGADEVADEVGVGALEELVLAGDQGAAALDGGPGGGGVGGQRQAQDLGVLVEGVSGMPSSSRAICLMRIAVLLRVLAVS